MIESLVIDKGDLQQTTRRCNEAVEFSPPIIPRMAGSFTFSRPGTFCPFKKLAKDLVLSSRTHMLHECLKVLKLVLQL